MDTQFILNIYGCAIYITSYVVKSARSMFKLLKKACDEAKLRNNNLKQRVRIIGNKFLNNVEVSAQEAVYLLLQLPLKKSSRQVIFINTSPSAECVYLLKVILITCQMMMMLPKAISFQDMSHECDSWKWSHWLTMSVGMTRQA